MSLQLNEVRLAGNLGRDVETKYTSGGKLYGTVSIATKETWKGEDGEKHEKTTWVNLKFWGKQAEFAKEWFHKGSPMYVEGRLEIREYEEDGHKKWFTEVVVSKIKFVESKGGGNEGGERPQVEVADIPAEDDIPF